MQNHEHALQSLDLQCLLYFFCVLVERTGMAHGRVSRKMHFFQHQFRLVMGMLGTLGPCCLKDPECELAKGCALSLVGGLA